jgi:acyl-coenzyme A synthetase/AMP-(fatty) acid ligase
MKNKVIRDISQAPTLTKEEQVVAAKLHTYREQALPGDDAVFDSAHGVFLIHGRHASLVGVEAVVAVDLASMLMAMSAVIQTTVVPMLLGPQRPVLAKKD